MKIKYSITEQDLQEVEALKKISYLDMIKPRSKRQIAIQSIITIVFEEFVRNLRVWIQNIFSPFINAVLYFTIFGAILGEAIGETSGVPYVNFLVPGFLMMPVMNAAYGNGVFTTFFRKYFRTLQFIQAAPINVHSFIIGVTFAVIVRSLIIALIIWLASTAFTGTFYIFSPLMSLVVLILVASIFGLCGMINAILAKNFEHINFIPTFIFTPLTYLSGTFFEVSELPTFFAKLSLLNPITYVVSSFRYTFLGNTAYNLVAAIIFFVALIIILYIIVVKLCKKHLNIH